MLAPRPDNHATTTTTTTTTTLGSARLRLFYDYYYYYYDYFYYYYARLGSKPQLQCYDLIFGFELVIMPVPVSHRLVGVSVECPECGRLCHNISYVFRSPDFVHIIFYHHVAPSGLTDACAWAGHLFEVLSYPWTWFTEQCGFSSTPRPILAPVPSHHLGDT